MQGNCVDLYTQPGQQHLFIRESAESEVSLIQCMNLHLMREFSLVGTRTIIAISCTVEDLLNAA